MPSQIFLFDQSRSASHLLRRIFGEQPNVELLDNAFGAPRGTQVGWLMSEDWANGMSETTQASFDREIQESIAKWRKASADSDKIMLTHDHPFSATPPSKILEVIQDPLAVPSSENFTQVPNDILLKPGTVPILTIREPRLAVTSAHRVLASFGLPHGSGRPNFVVSTATVWQRQLYNFFTANGIEPVVVDGDDVVTSRSFCTKLMTKLGLDAELAVFEWTPPSEAEKKELHPMHYASQKYLIDSSGVDSTRAARGRDLDAEEAKWDEEFGDDAALIREAVAFAQPHYEWLYERRYRG